MPDGVRMKKIYFLTLSLACLTFSAAPATEKLNYAAASVIAHTTVQMQRPGFWIARHPSPDAVILDAAGVQDFNEKLINAGLVKDLLNIDAFDRKISQLQIQKEMQKFERGDYFDEQGKPAARDFFREIKENVVLEDSPDWQLLQAFVVRQTDQRLLPTDKVLTSERFDLEFDELQNSSLDAGEPVVVLFETLDQVWVYAQTSVSAGWVKKENLAFVAPGEFKQMVVSKDFVVVTSAKVDLYLDKERMQFYDSVRMGTRFVVSSLLSDTIEVFIAPGQRMFIARRDIAVGYLSYTPRHIIEQAFKMLNAPYGWGGAHGEQDCSAFLKQIFATVGIALPRNSAEQGQSGALLGSNAQTEIFKKAFGGTVIAQLKGHIVLYLGMVDENPYVIHAAFAYREAVDGQDRVRVVNRVIVSDLSLGKGSKKGSLWERIVAIRAIK